MFDDFLVAHLARTGLVEKGKPLFPVLAGFCLNGRIAHARGCIVFGFHTFLSKRDATSKLRPTSCEGYQSHWVSRYRAHKQLSTSASLHRRCPSVTRSRI